MQFLQTENWVSTSLPWLVEVTGPLRALLQVLLAGTSRSERVPNNPVIRDEDWITE